MTLTVGTTNSTDYRDRVVLRVRLPYIQSSMFGYYTIMSKNQLLAKWIFGRILPDLKNGEAISLWHTNKDGSTIRIRSYEKRVPNA